MFHKTQSVLQIPRKVLRGTVQSRSLKHYILYTSLKNLVVLSPQRKCNTIAIWLGAVQKSFFHYEILLSSSFLNPGPRRLSFLNSISSWVNKHSNSFPTELWGTEKPQGNSSFPQLADSFLQFIFLTPRPTEFSASINRHGCIEKNRHRSC